jgi:hypothetical protein
MALRLNGSNSGYVELDVPAAAGSHTLTLPDGGGTSGNFLRTDGSGTLTWATPTDTTTNMTSGTAIDTSSATSAIFDNLPSGIQRLTVSFHDISPNANTQHGVRVRLRYGSGSTKSTGYSTFFGYQAPNGTGANVSKGDGFYSWCNENAEKTHAHMVLTRINANKWVYSTAGSFFNTYTLAGGGIADLGAELTGIICTFPSANFDSGLINIHYEV